MESSPSSLESSEYAERADLDRFILKADLSPVQSVITNKSTGRSALEITNYDCQGNPVLKEKGFFHSKGTIIAPSGTRHRRISSNLIREFSTNFVLQNTINLGAGVRFHKKYCAKDNLKDLTVRSLR